MRFGRQRLAAADRGDFRRSALQRAGRVHTLADACGRVRAWQLLKPISVAAAMSALLHGGGMVHAGLGELGVDEAVRGALARACGGACDMLRALKASTALDAKRGGGVSSSLLSAVSALEEAAAALSDAATASSYSAAERAKPLLEACEAVRRAQDSAASGAFCTDDATRATDGGCCAPGL